MKKPITMTLPVALTDDELLERADQLCHAEEKTEAIHIEMQSAKEAASQQRKRLEEGLDGQRAIRKRLVEQITSRTELRQVDCELLFVHDELRVVTVRKDTEEVVDVREMTADEQQLILGEEPVKLSAQIREMIERFEEQMQSGDDDEEIDDPGDPGE